MMSRPTAHLVNADGIPSVLKHERRCCLWRYRDEATRWSKVPCQPTGAYARSNDRSTWVSFAQAIGAYREGGFDGVGFMLGDGWAGIDLDHCRDTDERIADAAPEVQRLRALGAYLEGSRERHGLQGHRSIRAHGW